MVGMNNCELIFQFRYKVNILLSGSVINLKSKRKDSQSIISGIDPFE